MSRRKPSRRKSKKGSRKKSRKAKSKKGSRKKKRKSGSRKGSRKKSKKSKKSKKGSRRGSRKAKSKKGSRKGKSKKSKKSKKGSRRGSRKGKSKKSKKSKKGLRKNRRKSAGRSRKGLKRNKYMAHLYRAVPPNPIPPIPVVNPVPPNPVPPNPVPPVANPIIPPIPPNNPPPIAPSPPRDIRVIQEYIPGENSFPSESIFKSYGYSCDISGLFVFTLSPIFTMDGKAYIPNRITDEDIIDTWYNTAKNILDILKDMAGKQMENYPTALFKISDKDFFNETFSIEVQVYMPVGSDPEIFLKQSYATEFSEIMKVYYSTTPVRKGLGVGTRATIKSFTPMLSPKKGKLKSPPIPLPLLPPTPPPGTTRDAPISISSSPFISPVNERQQPPEEIPREILSTIHYPNPIELKQLDRDLIKIQERHGYTNLTPAVEILQEAGEAVIIDGIFYFIPNLEESLRNFIEYDYRLFPISCALATPPLNSNNIDFLMWADGYFGFDTEIAPGCIGVPYSTMIFLYNHVRQILKRLPQEQYIFDKLARDLTPEEIAKLNDGAGVTLISLENENNSIPSNNSSINSSNNSYDSNLYRNLLENKSIPSVSSSSDNSYIQQLTPESTSSSSSSLESEVEMSPGEIEEMTRARREAYNKIFKNQ